jgi:hypothetical protein
MDVRSKKPEPFAQSEDQDDELLSIVAIKGYVALALTFGRDRVETVTSRMVSKTSGYSSLLKLIAALSNFLPRGLSTQHSHCSFSI